MTTATRSEPVWPYGKFRGQPLRAAGRGYLAEVLTNHRIDPRLRRAIKETLTDLGLCFGRFKDVSLRRVPTYYLRWIATRENAAEYPVTKRIIDRELRRRERMNA
jgi:hypothetical protein